jgi:DNA-binding MarR family transcriptional regulator
LRRKLTQSYVDKAGLTQSQWRILSVVAEHPRMRMNDLVIEAAVDKALVSRVLRQLEVLGLVQLNSVPNAPRKGLECKLSEAQGATVVASTPAETAAFHQGELKKFQRAVQLSGFKQE